MRFPSELEEQLKEAIARTGETTSEFIRAAVAQRAAAIIQTKHSDLFEGIAGVIRSGGHSARESKDEFGDLLMAARARGSR